MTGGAPDERAGFRFRSSAEVDIDAYPLEAGAFALFAHVKDERAASDEVATGWITEFARPVVALGRALKTGSRSSPLSAVWLSEDGAGPRSSPEAAPELWAVEDDLRFLLALENVLNPGLFLDQRGNRRRLSERVRAAVADREDRTVRVLNLFSYTGAFSLAALASGAASTTSVDASSRYLAWEGRNLARNFPSTAGQCRLLRDDARAFLRRARTRGDRYSFIVMDPPTFSRGKKPFHARKDLPGLVSDAALCLENDAHAAIFVSSNDAGWSEESFAHDVECAAHDAGASQLRVETGVIPGDFPAGHALRSAWITR